MRHLEKENFNQEEVWKKLDKFDAVPILPHRDSKQYDLKSTELHRRFDSKDLDFDDEFKDTMRISSSQPMEWDWMCSIIEIANHNKLFATAMLLWAFAVKNNFNYFTIPQKVFQKKLNNTSYYDSLNKFEAAGLIKRRVRKFNCIEIKVIVAKENANEHRKS